MVFFHDAEPPEGARGTQGRRSTGVGAPAPRGKGSTFPNRVIGEVWQPWETEAAATMSQFAAAHCPPVNATQRLLEYSVWEPPPPSAVWGSQPLVALRAILQSRMSELQIA